jgi:DNA polymerase elongation subunit (family B)
VSEVIEENGMKKEVLDYDTDCLYANLYKIPNGKEGIGKYLLKNKR